MSRTLIKSLISSQYFFTLNKVVIKKLGLTEAAVLSVLADFENFADEDGWFYVTANQIQETLNIGRWAYDSVMRNIASSGVIETKLCGVPAKKYFKFNFDIALSLFTDNQECMKHTNKDAQSEQSSLYETNKQGCMNPTTNKIYTKNKGQEEPSSKKEKGTILNSSQKEETKLVQEVVSYWNARVAGTYTQIKGCSGRRKVSLLARLNAVGEQEFYKAIDIAMQSDFLKGSNDRGWKMDFDWLIIEGNLSKVLEGKYNNKVKTQTQTQAHVTGNYNPWADLMFGSPTAQTI